MKKVCLIILVTFLGIWLFFPAKADKDTVLMEEPLVYEQKLPQNDTIAEKEIGEEAVVLWKEEKEEEEIKGKTGSLLSEEIKGELLRSQQDNYVFSSLPIKYILISIYI